MISYTKYKASKRASFDTTSDSPAIETSWIVEWIADFINEAEEPKKLLLLVLRNK